MFCGQYIDSSTVVYIDPNVFNYTEINNAIKLASSARIFGDEIVIGLNTCIKQLPYVVCQSVYPRCNSTTQSLLPVCMANCMENVDGTCRFGFRALNVSAIINPLFEVLVIDCTNQFRAFGSVNIDLDSCYDFYCKV